ncbi:hypothetical protein HPG69_016413 [Diceros bicornis minor]|uniref:Uncharacterized protein n=1 Tax=Diceros bicornis minor TaxID=77932 RepID=A0A7J7EFA0_DICBM|nr:hypothetical protein HPG69_016413 [Diceros bicornis minor]
MPTAERLHVLHYLQSLRPLDCCSIQTLSSDSLVTFQSRTLYLDPSLLNPISSPIAPCNGPRSCTRTEQTPCLWLLSPPTGHTESEVRQTLNHQVTEMGQEVMLRWNSFLVTYTYIGVDKSWGRK